ncbi:hypothetical protein LNA02_02180 [Levilactobacillus namurensis]|nr:hypothetical protein [Levilactobacillus namurensis]PTM24338.1 hypothetical protein DA798_01765 [Lactobacillus sp. PFC-70]MCW3778095.1 hypothetical protein [Levilactobacillus namurensis]MDT7014621.1 hypothetical protein [Levilactobacillus namurensis]MDT7018443.1 hypothetical protein [Levilactobacillus namurensis]WNN64572.1 hypothetical protein RIN67_07570 [Levilactobacillus namurensis]
MEPLIAIILAKVTALPTPHSLIYDLEGLTEHQETELLTQLQAQAPTVKFRLSGRRDRVLEIRKS